MKIGSVLLAISLLLSCVACASLSDRIGATAGTLAEVPGDLVLAISKGDREVATVKLPDVCAQVVADTLDIALSAEQSFSPGDVLVSAVDMELCRRAIRRAMGDGTFYIEDMQVHVEEAA